MTAPGTPSDFGYSPVRPAAFAAPVVTCSLLVALPVPLAHDRVARALGPGARAETLLARSPIFWIRVWLDTPALPSSVATQLHAAGIATRYVASTEHPCLSLGVPLDVRSAPVVRAEGWPARRRCPPTPVSEVPGAWFLREGEGGVAVDRHRFGHGEGTRLAVVDHDARSADALDLDAEVLIGVGEASRHSDHGSLMVAWAASARGFSGVAPGATSRLYIIPKPGESLLWLPLAIVRAVLDGADVVVCATYVEGSTSPMLDDALAFAARCGRRGRGTAIVLPTGRETSSPSGSVHASLSLGFGEPASDPRVHCIAPGGLGGGWFFFRDRSGRSRPFSNRGPAVRWLAPGDDLAYPFMPSRLFHAESSGAAAVAAGVLLLVIATNPRLYLHDISAILMASAARIDPETSPRHFPLADPSDALPGCTDPDGHNAKAGYGRLHAGRACLIASDPICAALVMIGEETAARTFADARHRNPLITQAYPLRLARWAAREMARDPDKSHALRVLVRHMRLVARDDGRRRAHGDGTWLRQLAIVVRDWTTKRRVPRHVAADLDRLAGQIASAMERHENAANAEKTIAEVAADILSGSAGNSA